MSQPNPNHPAPLLGTCDLNDRECPKFKNLDCPCNPVGRDTIKGCKKLLPASNCVKDADLQIKLKKKLTYDRYKRIPKEQQKPQLTDHIVSDDYKDQQALFTKTNKPITSIREAVRKSDHTKARPGRWPVALATGPERHVGWSNRQPGDLVNHFSNYNQYNMAGFLYNWSKGLCAVFVPDELMPELLQLCDIMTTSMLSVLNKKLRFYNNSNTHLRSNLSESILAAYNEFKKGGPRIGPKLGSDRNARILVDQIIAKNGGSLQEVLKAESRASNSYAYYVQQTCDGLKYINENMEGNLKNTPIFTCGNCGVLNADILNPELLDGKGGYTKMPDIRCSCCWFSLAYEPSDSPDAAVYPEQVIYINMSYIGGTHNSLRDLLTANHVDGTIPDSDKELQVLKNYDHRLVLNNIGRLNINTMALHSGMSGQQLATLKAGFPNIFFGETYAATNPHALLANCRKAMTVTMLDLFSTADHIVDIGGNVTTSDNRHKNYHKMSPIMEWRDVMREALRDRKGSSCSHMLEECDCCETGDNVLMSVDTYDLDPEEVANKMKRMGTTTYCYCLSTNSVNWENIRGNMSEDQGHWFRAGDRFVMALNSEKIPYENGWENTKMWTTADVIFTTSGALKITTVNTCSNHLMRIATLSSGDWLNHDGQLAVENKPHERTLSVPFLDTNGLLNSIGPLIISRKKYKINMLVLAMMMAYNNDGSKGFPAMVEYGVQICNSRITLSDKTSKRFNLMADEIFPLAYIATISCKRFVNRIKMTAKTIMSNDNRKKHLSQLAVASAHSLLEAAGEAIFGDSVPPKIKKAQDWVNSLDSMSINALTDFNNDNLWDEVEGYAERRTVRQLRTWDASISVSSSVSTEPEEPLGCQHELPLEEEPCTDHALRCQCCGVFRVCMADNRCINCTDLTPCMHSCTHLCTGYESHVCKGPKPCKCKQTVCECCGVSTCFKECPVCNNHNMYQPSKLGPMLDLGKDNSVWLDLPKRRAERVYDNTSLGRDRSKPTKQQSGDEASVKKKNDTRPIMKDAKTIIEKKQNDLGQQMSSLKDEQLSKAAKGEEFIPTRANKRILQLVRDFEIQVMENASAETAKINETGKESSNSIDQLEGKMIESFDNSAKVATTDSDPIQPVDEELIRLTQEMYKYCLAMFGKEYTDLVHQGDKFFSSRSSNIYVFEPEFQASLTRNTIYNPYMPCGVQKVKNIGQVEIEELTNVTSVGAQCGLAAFNVATGLEVSEERCQKVTKKLDWLQISDLCNLAEYHDTNLMVIDANNITSAKFNKNSDMFHVVVHNSTSGETDKTKYHFDACRARVTGRLSNYMVPNCDTDMEVRVRYLRERGLVLSENFWGDNPGLMLLTIEAHLQDSLDQALKDVTTNTIPCYFEHRGKHFIGNTRNYSEVNFRGGKYLMEVPAKWSKYANWLNALSADELLEDPEFTAPYDVTTAMPKESELEDYLRDTFREKCKTIAVDLLKTRGIDLSIELGVESKPTFYQVEVHKISDNLGVFASPEANIKTGDLIKVKIGNKSTYHIASVDYGQIAVACRFTLNNVVKAMVSKFKGSLASSMIDLNSMTTKKCSYPKFVNMLRKSNCMIAAPGFGKTHEIVHTADKNWTCCAVTSEAQKNMRERLKELRNKVEVRSVESGKINQINTKVIAVDEATLVRWFDLYCIVGEGVEEIWLRGDQCQAGVQDMYITGGNRNKYNVTDYVDNPVYEWGTRRFSGDLLEEFKKLDSRYYYIPTEGVQEHKTEVILIDQSEIDYHQIIEVCNSRGIKVIYTHLEQAARLLKSKLPSDITVYKTFSTQGREFDKGMVVQWKPNSVETTGLVSDQNFNRSAASRWKQELVWVSVGINKNMPLHLRIKCGVNQPDPNIPDDDENMHGGGKSEFIQMLEKWKSKVKDNLPTLIPMACTVAEVEPVPHLLTRASAMRVRDMKHFIHSAKTPGRPTAYADSGSSTNSLVSFPLTLDDDEILQMDDMSETGQIRAYFFKEFTDALAEGTWIELQNPLPVDWSKEFKDNAKLHKVTIKELPVIDGEETFEVSKKIGMFNVPLFECKINSESKAIKITKKAAMPKHAIHSMASQLYEDMCKANLITDKSKVEQSANEPEEMLIKDVKRQILAKNDGNPHKCDLDSSECCNNKTAGPLDFEEVTSATIRLSRKAARKIRILSHLARLSEPSGVPPEINLGGNNNSEEGLTARIRAYDGCSFCACLLITDGRGLIAAIQNQYWTPHHRVVCVSNNADLQKVTNLLRQLDMESLLPNLGLVPSNSTLPQLIPGITEDNEDFNTGMLLDRLCAGVKNIPGYFKNLLSNVGCKSTDGTGVCEPFKHDNDKNMEKIRAKISTIPNSIFMSSDFSKNGAMNMQHSIGKVRVGPRTELFLLASNTLYHTGEPFENMPANTVISNLSIFQLQAAVLRAESNRMSWKIAKAATNLFGHASPNIGVGGSRAEDSLMLGLEFHSTNSTPAWQRIVEHRAKNLKRSLPSSANTLYVSDKHGDHYMSLLKEALPSCRIEIESNSHSDTGLLGLVEQVHLWALTATTKGKLPIKFITKFPQIPIMNSLKLVHAEPEYNEEQAYALNLISANACRAAYERVYSSVNLESKYRTEDELFRDKVITNSLESQKLKNSTGPWYSKVGKTPPPDEPYVCNLGVTVCNDKHGNLKTHSKNPNCIMITGLLPNYTQKENEAMFNIVNENKTEVQLGYHNSSHVITIDKSLYTNLLAKPTIELSGRTWVAQVKSNVFGHYALELTPLANTMKPPTFTCESILNAKENKVILHVPTLTTNIVAILNGKSVLKTQKIEISRHLWNALCTRASIPKTTLKDLFVYSRGLLNATMYGYESFWSQHKEQTEKMMLACMSAHYVVSGFYKSFNQLMSLTEKFAGSASDPNNIWFGPKERLLSAVLGTYSTVVESLGLDVRVPTIAEMMSQRSSSSTKASVINKIGSAMCDAEFKILEASYTLLRWGKFERTEVGNKISVIKERIVGAMSSAGYRLFGKGQASVAKQVEPQEQETTNSPKKQSKTPPPNFPPRTQNPRSKPMGIELERISEESSTGSYNSEEEVEKAELVERETVQKVHKADSPIKDEKPNPYKKNFSPVEDISAKVIAIGAKVPISETAMLNLVKPKPEEHMDFETACETGDAIHQLKTSLSDTGYINSQITSALKSSDYANPSKLKFLFCTFGTRGDFESMVVLAETLKLDLTIATYENHRAQITSRGIKFFGLPGNSEEQMNANQVASSSKTPPVVVNTLINRYETERMEASSSFEMLDKIASQYDMLMETPQTNILRHMAEHYGKKYLPISMYQWEASHCPLNKPSVTGLIRSIKPELEMRLKLSNSYRNNKGLTPETLEEMVNNNLNKEIIFSEKPLWTSRTIGSPQHCGYPMAKPSSQEIMSELPNYKNIVFTSGSTSCDHYDKALEALICMLKEPKGGTSEVCLTVVGSCDIEKFMSTSWCSCKTPACHHKIHLKSANYTDLLPSTDVLIHHGGSGTCNAALKAGTFQVIIPMIADQFYNASALSSAGLALHVADLNTLGEAVKTATVGEYRFALNALVTAFDLREHNPYRKFLRMVNKEMDIKVHNKTLLDSPMGSNNKDKDPDADQGGNSSGHVQPGAEGKTRGSNKTSQETEKTTDKNPTTSQWESAVVGDDNTTSSDATQSSSEKDNSPKSMSKAETGDQKNMKGIAWDSCGIVHLTNAQGPTILNDLRLPVGTSFTNCELAIVTFDPDTEDDCFRQCLHKFLKDNKLRYRLDELFKMLKIPEPTSMHHIQAVCKVMHLNVLIKEGHILIASVNNERWNTVCLEIKRTANDKLKHCTCIYNLQLSDRPKLAMNQVGKPISGELLNGAICPKENINCTTLVDGNTKTCAGHLHMTSKEVINLIFRLMNDPESVNNEEFQTLRLKDNNVNSWKAKMRTANLGETIFKNTNPLLIIPMTNYADYSIGHDGKNQLEIGRIYKLGTSSGWVNCACAMGKKGTKVLLHFGGMSVTGPLLVTPSKWFEVPDSPIRHIKSAPATISCINKVSRGMAEAEGLVSAGTTLGEVETCDTLIVGKYDNRKHHKYSTEIMLHNFENWDKVVWVGLPPDSDNLTRIGLNPNLRAEQKPIERDWDYDGPPDIVKMQPYVTTSYLNKPMGILETDISDTWYSAVTKQIERVEQTARLELDSTSPATVDATEHEQSKLRIRVANWHEITPTGRGRIDLWCSVLFNLSAGNGLSWRWGPLPQPTKPLNWGELADLLQISQDQADMKAWFTRNSKLLPKNQASGIESENSEMELKSDVVFIKPNPSRVTSLELNILATDSVCFTCRSDGSYFEPITKFGLMEIANADLTGGVNDYDEWRTADPELETMRNFKHLDQRYWPIGEEKITPKPILGQNIIPVEATRMAIISDYCRDVPEINIDNLLAKPLKIRTGAASSVQLPIDLSEEYVEMTPSEVVNFWEHEDLTDWNTRYTPANNMLVKSKTSAKKIGTSIKTTMTKYPIYSRPVLTKAANSEFNNFVGLMSNKKIHRKVKLSAAGEVKRIKNAYFSKNGLEDKINSFKANPLTIDGGQTQEWLKNKPDGVAVALEVKEIIDQGMLTHPLNKVKVHLKIESLLKADPVSFIKETKCRMIVWQQKGIAAIFSPIFMQAKARLKSLLRPGVVYADGMTPGELSAECRQISAEGIRFFENDLTKQDRQTDSDMLDVEFEMYKLLGVDEDVLKLWRRVHHYWYYRGKAVAGVLDEMRLTGQATTAIGNVIVNMAVHSSMVVTNYSNVKLILMLGDDNCMAYINGLNLNNFRRTVQTHYNMESKASKDLDVGTFCQMLMYRTHTNRVEIGPDVIRLRYRFEVDNGTTTQDSELVINRCMSYCMMLGDRPEVTALAMRDKWPIRPEGWYTITDASNAAAAKHDVSPVVINGHYAALMNMMTNRNQFTYKWIHPIEPNKP